MKYISLFVTILTIASCTAFKKQSVVREVGGEYYKEFSDGTNYSLVLNYDSTFSYIIKGGLAHSGTKCDGVWHLSSDTIFLQCSEEKFPTQISSGYMNEREKKVIRLNRNKVKIDNIVLKKSS